MAISYVGAGTFGSGTTSCLSNYPAGAATDAILTLIGHKPYTSTATATGYTGLGSITSGSVANAVSTGSVRATAGLRNTSPTAAGGDTISVTSGSPTMAMGLRFARGTGTAWSVAGIGIADTSETLLAVDANDGGGTAAGMFQAGDMVAISVVLKDDAITHTSQAFTIAGCTLGTITWLARQSTTTGNDGAMYFGYVPITAGSSNGVTQYTATSNTAGASSCACTVVRLREVTATPTGLTSTGVSPSQINVSWNSVTNATSYTLERSPDGSTGWSTVYTGATVSFSDTGLSGATAYFYRVSATSSLGTSAVSATVSASTFYPLPFSDDFSAGNWNKWALATGDDAPTVVSGAGVLTLTASSFFERVSALAAKSPSMGLLLKFKASSTSSTLYFSFGDGSWGSFLPYPQNGYDLRLDSGGGAIMHSISASTQTQLTNGGTFVPSAATWFWLRFELLSNGTLRAKTWLDGAGEPGVWDVTNNDTSKTPTSLQIAHNGSIGDTLAIDDVSFYDPDVAAPQGIVKPGNVGRTLAHPQAVHAAVR